MTRPMIAPTNHRGHTDQRPDQRPGTHPDTTGHHHPSTTRTGPRDCTCPRAQHQHGTRRAYLADRCRCRPCRDANAADLRAYRLELARRRWHGTSAWVDSTGTRRRVQALAAAGWSADALAGELGVTRSAVYWMRNAMGARCTVRIADRVAGAYERLWHVTPAGAAVERTCRWAERAGWAGPWQWEGVDLDDPAAVPLPAADAAVDLVAVEQAMHGRRVVLTRRERALVVERLAGLGLSDREIGERLGTSLGAVLKIRERRGIAAGLVAA